MTDFGGSHLFALNLTNAALGIFVAGIVLAVLVAAFHDGAVQFRRWWGSRRPKANLRLCATPDAEGWRREDAS